MRKVKEQEYPDKLLLFQNDNLLIEQMSLYDLEDVMQIELACFESPWSRSYVIHEIEKNPVSYPIVLRKRDDNRIAGFGICWIMPEELHITNVAVHPDYRNRGYGGHLVRALLDVGRKHNCVWAVLEVRISNREAIRLYSDLGFRIAGVAPHYYDNNGEDAYILRRTL